MTDYMKSNPEDMLAKEWAIITAEWGEGDYRFGLSWPLVADWEKTTDRSLFNTFLSIIKLQVATVEDVREIVRRGLIGGGATPVQALRLVKLYVDARPLAESIPLTIAIAEAFFHGNDAYNAKPEGDAVQPVAADG